jgi:hypothetical protein
MKVLNKFISPFHKLSFVILILIFFACDQQNQQSKVSKFQNDGKLILKDTILNSIGITNLKSQALESFDNSQADYFKTFDRHVYPGIYKWMNKEFPEKTEKEINEMMVLPIKKFVKEHKSYIRSLSYIIRDSVFTYIFNNILFSKFDVITTSKVNGRSFNTHLLCISKNYGKIWMFMSEEDPVDPEDRDNWKTVLETEFSHEEVLQILAKKSIQK